ncbi:LysE family translocator [Candidatus Bathyarchaeota archaeon]|nr:LysE family translocator [Candidatus Bathyarchaeota archaeon]
MFKELEFLLSGIVFGLAAGISPGPLFALIISETLKRGKKEGAKVAVSPLITDIPVVLLVLFILSNLVEHNLVIGIISLFGACFLIYLGKENLQIRTKETEVRGETKSSFKRAVIVNMLNPNPYIFWLFVGGPMVFRGFQLGISASAVFLVGFYSLLVGSNIGIVLVVEKSKSFIRSKYYVYVIRALGFALILFALFFVYEGLRLMGLY